MKRLLPYLAFVLGAAFVGGCPMYTTSRDYAACGANGRCFDCPAGSTPSGGTCIPWQCTVSSDCPLGYVCGGNACLLASDASDCSITGCPADFICRLSGGQAQCVPMRSPSNDSGPSVDATATMDSSADDGGSDGPPDGRGSAPDGSDGSYASDAANGFDATGGFDSSDTSNSIDAPDGLSASEASGEAAAPNAADADAGGPCNATDECGGGGAKCIDGLCTPQGRLCSDSTQCIATGAFCVDGVCEPHCSADAPCPGGYGCDFIRGVCNVNPNPCGGFGMAICQGGSACVEGRCVAPCAAGDGATACPSGQLCVHGGCIPDERAKFDCKNDGQSGQLATACSASAICLHHDCYAACDPDAGAAACSDPAAACKQVTVTAGTYVVCGSATKLGSECDPAAGKYCSGAVCIDGYCR